jgi:hypothetical protein
MRYLLGTECTFERRWIRRAIALKAWWLPAVLNYSNHFLDWTLYDVTKALRD